MMRIIHKGLCIKLDYGGGGGGGGGQAPLLKYWGGQWPLAPPPPPPPPFLLHCYMISTYGSNCTEAAKLVNNGASLISNAVTIEVWFNWPWAKVII